MVPLNDVMTPLRECVYKVFEECFIKSETCIKVGKIEVCATLKTNDMKEKMRLLIRF